MLRMIVFAVLSSVLAYVSRASLRSSRSHGFYRFFAWECILALFCLNFVSFRKWFGNPLSVRQLASWLLLIACVIPAVCGVHLLRIHGKPATQRSYDGSLIWIEKTTQLVTTGIFGYIRHPLYSSLLLLAWGVFLKRPSWSSGGLALGATAFLLATAKTEEKENLRYFGAPYREYMQRSKMFIPFVF